MVSSTSTTLPPVLVAMQDALAAWGEFAVTGRMRDLGEFFVSGGPQRRLLRSEAAAIRQDSPGLPSYEVTARDVFTVSVSQDDVVMRAEVVWSRDGEQTQVFVWDIQMQRVDGTWQLLTVQDVTELEASG